MALKSKSNLYAECDHIKREKPDLFIDDKIAKKLGSDYRTLPTFEKSVYDYIQRNYYSLQTNELLKCRWQQYKKHIEERVFAPFQFPEIRDLHFHNCAIHYRPSLSIHKMTDYRMKMKLGPGVDFRGQMPIPHESLMKRGNPVKDLTKEKNGKKKLKENINK